ncbi:MAG: MraY family glycosyltransferase [Solirubrobacterales bacterium]
MILSLLALSCFALSLVATRVVLGWLRHRQILDLPNERSSHTRPTPRGGGLAVTPVALVGLLAAALVDGALPATTVAVPAACALLVLSWVDDRRSLSARLRLGVHLLAVAAVLATLPADRLVFQGLLPLALDRVITALAWGWFINLYNFMDGIDGITGVETASLGLGLALAGTLAGAGGYSAPGIVLAAVAVGFLIFNWHPAKLFMGDSGSVPLGFLLGWLLVLAATDGLWAPALILPLYYLADATITITRRALRGERIWQAHRQHFYQRAAARLGHAPVSLAVLGCNLLLVASAALALFHPLAGLAAGAGTVALFLAGLGRWAGPGSSAASAPTR